MLRISGDHTSPIVPASGPPLGIVPDLQWSDDETVLKPGETLLLYTDGIVEARGEWVSDPNLEKFHLTVNHNGYLKRLR